jgi:hypothetical protein
MTSYQKLTGDIKFESFRDRNERRTFGIISLLSFNIWTSVCQGTLRYIKRLHLLISHATTDGCMPMLNILGTPSEVAVQTEYFCSSYTKDFNEKRPKNDTNKG